MAIGTSPDQSLLQRLLRQARPYRLHVLGILMLDLLSTPLALLNPVPLKIAVDNVLGSAPMPSWLELWLPAVARFQSARLLLAACLMVALALLRGLQGLASSLLRAYTGEKLVLGLRAQLFRHAQRLSLAYHDSHGTSDSVYRIQYDTQAAQYIGIDLVVQSIVAGITLMTMLFVIFRIDWLLALVALAVSPVLFWLARLYRRDLRERAREAKKIESGALSVVQEVLASLHVVKAYGQEDREQERFVRRSNEGMRARMHYTLSEGGLGLLLALTTALGTASVLYIGVRHVQSNTLTLGSLLLVMGYLSQLYDPLQTISRKVATLAISPGQRGTGFCPPRSTARCRRAGQCPADRTSQRCGGL